jgi:hypothetical protein
VPDICPARFRRFNVGNDPSRVRDLNPPEGVSFARSERRREMLRTMDAFTRHVEESPAARDRDAFYEQAYRLLASPEAKGAFELSQEKPAARERYGSSRHRDRLPARAQARGGGARAS